MTTMFARVGLIGFEGREKGMLEVFFSGSEAQGLQLDAPERSDALLVNVQSADALLSFRRWFDQQSVKRPAVLVVSELALPAPFIALERPLTLHGLKQALNVLRDQLEAAPLPEAGHAGGERRVTTRVLDAQALRALVDETLAAEKARSAQVKSVQAENTPIPSPDTTAAPRAKSPHTLALEEDIKALTATVGGGLAADAADSARAAASASVAGASSAAALPADEEASTDGTQALTWSPAQQVELVKHCCGSLPDLDLEREAGRRRLSINLEGRLLIPVREAIAQADTEGNPVQITGIPGMLVYFPALDRFSYDLDPEFLLQMSATRFAPGELTLTQRPDLTQPQSPTLPRDELVWMLALMTTQGRVPESVPLDKPLQLAKLPDFTRLLAMPHGKSIAALWQASPQSALDIVQTLGIAQRFVFSFLVAADATGLFERK